MPPDPNGVLISMRDIYDQLILTKDSVRDLKLSVDNYKQDIDDVKSEALRRSEDIETRMRSVERWRYSLPGLATILAIASLIVTVYSTFGGK